MSKKVDPGAELVKSIQTGLPKGIEVDEREEATAESGLAPLTLHECRHTFASLLIDAGVTPRRSRSSWVTQRSRRPSIFSGTCCPGVTMRGAPEQKTPRREGGAFLGLLQGGEICISIYVDQWEVGRDP